MSNDDLRTRLLRQRTRHNISSGGAASRSDLYFNPDGPEAVAALDERDARIKALEAIIDLRNLLTNSTPAKE